MATRALQTGIVLGAAAVLVAFQNCAAGLQLAELGGDAGALVNFKVGYQRRLLTDDVGDTAAAGTRAPAELMARLKYQGCMFNGLLTDGVQPSFDDLLARSACAALPRAIETWTNPPDFARIQRRIGEISAKTSGRSFDYGMFIAEAISLKKTYADASGAAFDFRAMCTAGTEGQWGADTCVPAVRSAEYRRYILYVSKRAIDLGVSNILFGQTGHQDPTYELGAVLGEIRAYARAQGKNVLLGQQPNGHQPESYLKSFDYVVGPVYVDIDTNKSSCLDFGGGGCQAVLQHPSVVNRAHNVIVELDWHSNEGDDTHKFARKTAVERHAYLADTTKELRARGVGFTQPFRQWLTGDKSGRHCYGANEWVYSPDMQFGCKDEQVINLILKGVSGAPAEEESVVTTPETYVLTSEVARQEVIKAYMEILGRTQAETLSDEAGIQYWVGQLVGGGLTVQKLRAAFADSDEKFVRDLYKTILKRAPDMAGVKYYVAELAKGRTRAQVRADIQYACDQGLNGECGGGVKPQPTPQPTPAPTPKPQPTPKPETYVLTKEVARQEVIKAYMEILGRTQAETLADEAGIQYWVNRMISGGLTIQKLRAAFADSDEKFVRDLYWTILKRAPDMAGVKYYVSELAKGRTRAQVRADIQYACDKKLNGECSK